MFAFRFRRLACFKTALSLPEAAPYYEVTAPLNFHWRCNKYKRSAGLHRVCQGYLVIFLVFLENGVQKLKIEISDFTNRVRLTDQKYGVIQ